MQQTELFRIPASNWIVSLGDKPKIFTDNNSQQPPKLIINRRDKGGMLVETYETGYIQVYKPVLNWGLSIDKTWFSRVELPIDSTEQDALDILLKGVKISPYTKKITLSCSRIADLEASDKANGIVRNKPTTATQTEQNKTFCQTIVVYNLIK